MLLKLTSHHLQMYPSKLPTSVFLLNPLKICAPHPISQLGQKHPVFQAVLLLLRSQQV